MSLSSALSVLLFVVLLVATATAQCPTLSAGQYCTASNPNLSQGSTVKAGFYVSKQQTTQALCSTSNTAYPSYPSGYCLPDPFQMIVSAFSVKVVYTGNSCASSAKTGLTATMSSSQTINFPYQAANGPSTDPATNWITTSGVTVPSLTGCTYAYTLVTLTFTSNDQKAQSPLQMYLHVAGSSGSGPYYTVSPAITASGYFAPDPPSAPTPAPTPTPSSGNGCPADSAFPPPVTDYANYPNAPANFIPSGCTKDGAAVLNNVVISVQRSGSTTWDSSNPSDMRAYGNINPGDKVRVAWSGAAAGCNCVPISISVKKTNYPTFVGTDNQALMDNTMDAKFARVGVADSVTTFMPSREISCNYQIDSVIGPPLRVVGPQGSYYGTGTRTSNGKNNGPNMLVAANNGGQGTCTRLFVPQKYWQNGVGGSVSQATPPGIPGNWAISMANSKDGTSGTCTYSAGSLACTYNNNGKTTSTSGMFVNVGNGGKVTITETAWSLASQVGGIVNGVAYAAPGVASSSGDDFVTCDNNGVCTIRVLNRVIPTCAAGGPSCGCAGNCLTVQMQSVAAPTQNSRVTTWSVTNPAGCASMSKFVVCTDGFSFVASQSPFTVPGSYTDTTSGCVFTVSSNSAGFFPCGGILFTPTAGCLTAGKNFRIPISTVTPTANAGWTFYSQASGGTTPNLAVVSTDQTCPVAPPPPTTTTTTTTTTSTTPRPTTTTTRATTVPGQTTTTPRPTTTTVTFSTLPPPTTLRTRPTTVATTTTTTAPTTTVAVTTTQGTGTNPTTTTTLPTTTRRTTPRPTFPTDAPTFAPIPDTTGPQSQGVCARKGFAPPNCNGCVDLSDISLISLCVPVAGSTNPVVYEYTPTPITDPRPAGSVVPGDWGDNGFLLDCDCKDKMFDCAGGCLDDPYFCVCDRGYGQCIQSDTCAITTPEPTTDCPPNMQCPANANGDPCNNKGACQCGVCSCGSINGVTYSGPSCEVSTIDCSGYSDCSGCMGSPSCQWCPNAATCVPITSDGLCSSTDRAAISCVADSQFVAATCPNNCTSPERGTCGVDPVSNATVCLCVGSAHGSDCSLDGGLNVGALAGGITGGIIAAIVIAAAIILLFVIIGTKKAVDWAMLNNQAMASSTVNPTFIDPSSESFNPGYNGDAHGHGHGHGHGGH